jgi:two-component system chemotaxis sensor kinase CheA
MMDRVGELVIAQSRLKQLAASSSDIALRAVAEEIERLAAEMRDTMMVVRMVPIAQLFGRFRRLIHDLARDTGKTIELSTEGETTELDKTVIERLADPLIHLIRNAADHGLETPSSAWPPASPKPDRSFWPPASRAPRWSSPSPTTAVASTAPAFAPRPRRTA